MISVKCPHCKVGLKVEETKIPTSILSFKCPKCKKEIPISYIEGKLEQQDSGDTVVQIKKKQNQGMGRLTVLQNESTPQQGFQLKEGENIVGRKAKVCTASICIFTDDKMMSRSHLNIEVKKNPKGGYFHYLSDNNSTNHTLYNGKNIESGDIFVLNDGDELIIGQTTIRFNE
jgi:pSer/pThr/pTyr-binding forkhead associated (FHA) protein